MRAAGRQARGRIRGSRLVQQRTRAAKPPNNHALGARTDAWQA